MKQTVLVGEDLNKCAERLDILHFTFVNLTNFGNRSNAFDLFDHLVAGFEVVGNDVDDTKFTNLFNNDGGAGFTLHLLDDLAAGANDGTDEFLGNLHLENTGNKRFEVGTWFGDGLFHFTEDMHASLAGL